MLYQAYQFYSDVMLPARKIAELGFNAAAPFTKEGKGSWAGNFAAACELISRARLTHKRPPYGIGSVRGGNRDVEVTEEALAATPFGTLLHFKKDIQQTQPRVLVVAPLSGLSGSGWRTTYVSKLSRARTTTSRPGRRLAGARHLATRCA